MKLSTVFIVCCGLLLALVSHARGSDLKRDTVLICQDDLHSKMRSLCTVENMLNTYKRMKFLSRNKVIRRIADKYKRTRRSAADEEDEEYEGGPPARRLKNRRNRNRRRRRTERRLNRRKRAPSSECCHQPCSVERIVADYCMHFITRYGS